MDTRIVLDLETKKTFDEVGGKEHIDQLGITVVGVYDYLTKKYEIYEEHELGRLQNRLIDCSLIVGFNHIGFDLPVLQPYFSVDVSEFPVLDLMVELQEQIGHRIGLDSVAQATLGIGKTGHGLDAIRYYREGKMQELKDYCLQDVKVTKDVFEHGIKHGKVSYVSRFGKQDKEVKVKWKGFKKPQLEEINQAQYKLF
jgi:DEAD/DEAH box helicase domain-containing protein